MSSPLKSTNKMIEESVVDFLMGRGGPEDDV